MRRTLLKSEIEASQFLVIKLQMITAVLLPARLAFFRAKRLFFAVADDPNATGVHAFVGKCLLECFGAVLSKGDVVFYRAAVIAVTLNENLYAGMTLQKRRVLFYCRCVSGTEVVFVIVEVNVAHVLSKQLFVSSRRNGTGRRLRHGHSYSGLHR